MGLIKFFCIRFFLIKSSTLLRLNSPKSEFLYPKILIFFEILIPLAIAIETLVVEKLPGPLFTKIEKSLSNFTLCF